MPSRAYCEHLARYVVYSLEEFADWLRPKDREAIWQSVYNCCTSLECETVSVRILRHTAKEYIDEVLIRNMATWFDVVGRFEVLEYKVHCERDERGGCRGPRTWQYRIRIYPNSVYIVCERTCVLTIHAVEAGARPSGKDSNS